jgi:hypothetical protein
VYVDVDNNPQTGYPYGDRKGAEFSLAAMHFVGQPDSSVVKPIADHVHVNVWQHRSPTSWRSISYAALDLDAESDVMTLTGDIPGINLQSRLILETYGYNPGATIERDVSYYSDLTDLARKPRLGKPVVRPAG